MLVGILKQDSNVFYVYLKENDKKIEVCVVLSDEKQTRILNKDEAVFMLKKILSSKTEYKETKDGYDIYIDEAGNKRFYKNGTEDYLMFYKNNGVSAILCEGDSEEKKNGDGSKAFLLVIGAIVVFLTMSQNGVELTRNENGITNFEYVNDVNIENDVKKSNVDINIDEIKDYIYSSEYLSDDEKNMLYNEDFMLDFLAIADRSRNYDIRNKLDNIKVNVYDDQDDPRSGYYDRLKKNEIYINSKGFSDYNGYLDILTHEFIHLMQSNNEYRYISEACAEILKNEYYGFEITSYPGAVKNVKLLIELIGPEPILECNFTNNTTKLKKIINQNLSSKDANRLLTLFKTTGQELFDSENADKINNEINELLKNMYKNIDNPNKVSESLFWNGTDGRVYFNQSNYGYDQDLLIPNDKIFINQFSIDDVDYSNIAKYTYFKKEEPKDQFDTGVRSYEVSDMSSFANNNDFIYEIKSFFLNEDFSSMVFYFNDGTSGDVYYNYQNRLIVQQYTYGDKYEEPVSRKFNFRINRDLYRSQNFSDEIVADEYSANDYVSDQENEFWNNEEER